MNIADIKARAESLGEELTDDVHVGLVDLGQQRDWRGVVTVLRTLASRVSTSGIRFASYAGVAMKQYKRAEARHAEQDEEAVNAV